MFSLSRFPQPKLLLVLLQFLSSNSLDEVFLQVSRDTSHVTTSFFKFHAAPAMSQLKSAVTSAANVKNSLYKAAVTQ